MPNLPYDNSTAPNHLVLSRSGSVRFRDTFSWMLNWTSGPVHPPPPNTEPDPQFGLRNWRTPNWTWTGPVFMHVFFSGALHVYHTVCSTKGHGLIKGLKQLWDNSAMCAKNDMHEMKIDNNMRHDMRDQHVTTTTGQPTMRDNDIDDDMRETNVQHQCTTVTTTDNERQW